jgi:pilus assembly protein CpaF
VTTDEDPRALFRRPLVVTPPAHSGRDHIRNLDIERGQSQPVRSTIDAPSIQADLQERLLAELSERNLADGSEESLREEVEAFVARVVASEDLALNTPEQEQLAENLVQEALGVGPLAPLLNDPAVTDVLVNGPDRVYVERHGRLELTNVRFRDGDHILRIIERIAMRAGRRIDRSWPMVDLRLPDGSRVNATIPPVSLDSPTLSIRLFGRQRLRQADLLRHGSLSEDMATFLRAAVAGRQNIVLSGGTGAGKSTLLSALCEAIPTGERIVTIEDTAELRLDQEHVVRLEARPANVEGQGTITVRDLVVNALRMRPSRIIVGEARAGEALDMLQAMNTGHDGSLATIHANSPRSALARLETMVLMAGQDLPSRAIREQIVAAIQLVVHVRRDRDGVRRVSHIAEVTGLEGETPQMQDVFRFKQSGVSDGHVSGHFVPTGIVPRCLERLREQGFDVPVKLFQTGRAP